MKFYKKMGEKLEIFCIFSAQMFMLKPLADFGLEKFGFIR